jgi:hypothetical protein
MHTYPIGIGGQDCNCPLKLNFSTILYKPNNHCTFIRERIERKKLVALKTLLCSKPVCAMQNKLFDFNFFHYNPNIILGPNPWPSQ